MQVAFYFAGEITQVLDAIPWVRCASGNVFRGFPIILTFRGFFYQIDFFRGSFHIDPTEPVAQNFYPVTSMITIRCLLLKHFQLSLHQSVMTIITPSISDDEQQFGVVTDRAQGGSSLEVGRSW